MGNLAYFPLTDDLIDDDDTVITVETGTIVADYPLTKLQNIPMADTTRITPAGGIVKLGFDLGGGNSANLKFWAFLNHNIESGNWLVASYTDNNYNVVVESHSVPHRNYDAKLSHNWDAPSQFWGVTFGAGCSYPGAFWEMGKILSGLDVTEFSKGVSPGIERGLGHRNIHLETEFGVTWDYALQENINYLGIRWDPDIKATLLNEILAFIRLTKGGAYPAVIIPDKDEAEVYYMKNQDRLNWWEEMARSIIRNCVMNFAEMSRGKIMSA